MKLSLKITIIVFCVFLTGCNESVKQSPDNSLINGEMIKTYNDIALEKAIISQHTIYPYHFVQNSAQLNELGKRDLNVLIKHFINSPGYLNIRKSDTPSELYTSRVELIYQKLEKADLNMDKIEINDDMSGETGMASEKIIVILQKENILTTSTD